ncbi:hypothetical protein TIFTF001_010476 [Ficus carica]|uniref:Uncharacterized protein n=1 Tax=Ficus carica TaxID=3494 RepID=A0AA87ZX25_FICCA|nr:hypothetical protein TIFTF001_010476 [Ficus carica]
MFSPRKLLRFNRTVETLLVYHTYHIPYLILSFPPKVFSVVGDLPTAGDRRQQPTTGPNPGRPPANPLSLLRRPTSGTPCHRPPPPHPAWRPPSPGLPTPRLPLSLSLFLPQPSPGSPHTTPDVRRKREREGELRVRVGWGGAGRPGVGGLRVGKRERGEERGGEARGVGRPGEGGRRAGWGGRGASWGLGAWSRWGWWWGGGGARSWVTAGEEKRERREKRERGFTGDRSRLGPVVGGQRWVAGIRGGSPTSVAGSGKVAGNGEDFGWK